jgi:SAM-dependent methyltransferase
MINNFLGLSYKTLLYKIYIKIFNIKINKIQFLRSSLKFKNGIEIGGPSNRFNTNSFCPLYDIVDSLDNINFSISNLWSKNDSFYNNKKNTFLNSFIADATYLDFLESNYYDFVLSCNNLEHIANPIKAIYEWNRVLNINGILLLVLPNKISNFDHNRIYTKFEHILDDFNNDIKEDDLTHLHEVLSYHDLNRDPKAGNFDNFRQRCLDNYNNRAMHHHVFNIKLLEDILKYCGMTLIYKEVTYTDLYIIAQKCVTK